MPKYTTADGRTKWTRVVYVIDLGPEACEASGSTCMGGCVGAVYVGATALDPEERLKQHLDGVKSSRWVRRSGIGLNHELTAHLPEYDTVDGSQDAEHQLGEELRGAGYCVFGAH
jgi:hypothetical protein